MNKDSITSTIDPFHPPDEPRSGAVATSFIIAIEDIAKLKSHPAAELFPLFSDQELKDLAEDIQENGLLEPIVLYDGMILDGRNRLRACQSVGVTPTFVTLNGDGSSPVAYVVSKNLHRRHLTTGQRAAIAVEARQLLKEEAKQRQIQHLKHVGKSSFASNEANEQSEPGYHVDRIVGDALQISRCSVQRAAEVQERDVAVSTK